MPKPPRTPNKNKGGEPFLPLGWDVQANDSGGVKTWLVTQTDKPKGCSPWQRQSKDWELTGASWVITKAWDEEKKAPSWSILQKDKSGNVTDLSLPASWVNELFSGRGVADYKKDYPQYPKKKYRYSDYPQTFEGVAIACADAAKSDSYLSNLQASAAGKVPEDDLAVSIIVSFLDLLRSNPLPASEYRHPWSKSGEKIASQGITKLKMYIEWKKQAQELADESDTTGF